ncbi:MAG: hypothetical protein ABW252_14135 [Polyangiales bacterium]
MPRTLPLAVALVGALAACGDEPPAHSDVAPPAAHRAQTSVAPPAPSDPFAEGTSDCGGLPLAPPVFLDPGHSAVQQLHRSGDRVLSRGEGRWMLWDTSTRRQIAQGTFSPPRFTRRNQTSVPSDLAGNVFLVPVSASVVELRDLRDGRLLASPQFAPGQHQTGLSVDGSYVYSATREGLAVFGTDGTPRFRRAGDYLRAVIFAGLGALYVADGPTRTATVETLRLDGTSTFSTRYAGRFKRFFSDGSHFVTAATTRPELTVHTPDGRPVQTFTVPPRSLDDLQLDDAGGHGRHVWWKYGDDVSAMPLGAKSPSFTLHVEGWEVAAEPNGTVSWTDENTGEVTRLHLDGEAPRSSTVALPARLDGSTFVSAPDGGWAAATRKGVVSIGDASAPLARLGCGQVRSIAGAPTGRLAIGTADDRVRIYDPDASGARPLRTLVAPAGELSLSDDGGLLFALGTQDYGSEDRALRVFQLPAGALVHTFAVRGEPEPERHAFAISRDGRTVARLVCVDPPNEVCTVSLDQYDGTPIVNFPLGIRRQYGAPFRVLLSPQGTHVAITTDGDGGILRLHDRAGTLVAANRQVAHGFIADDRLLVGTGSRYETVDDRSINVYQHAVLDLRGVLVATAAETRGFTYGAAEKLDDAHVFDRVERRIVRLSDGTARWLAAEDALVSERSGRVGDRVYYTEGGLVVSARPTLSVR